MDVTSRAIPNPIRISDLFFRILLRREIDRPFLRFYLKAVVLIIPAIALYVLPVYTLYILPLHLAVYVYFLGPFITMFHDINHSPLFKGKWINAILTDGFGLLYGSTPKTYFTHHVIMHHPENNERDDISSTLPLQRDSFKDFFGYYVRFFFCLLALSKYLGASRNKSVSRFSTRLVVSELITVSIIVGLLIVNPLATIGVFILPIIVTRTLLIIGNWGEHAFIDPADPGNLYTNSTNIVGFYNKACFNVGYHIGHHIRPALHFTLLEKDFDEHVDRYAQEDAVVFKDLHYPHIWFYLMTRNYKQLAEKYVQLPGRHARTESEIIELLKQRVAPIG